MAWACHEKAQKSSHQHVSCLMKAVISRSAAWQKQLTCGLSTKNRNTSGLSTKTEHVIGDGIWVAS
jgi:hypothetical protein